MNYFTFKDALEVEEDGRKVLSVDINPEKSCIFNCLICNKASVHMGKWHDFGPVEDSLQALGEKIAQDRPDLVHIYAKGEPLTNANLENVINYVHSLGLPTRLLVNAYLLGVGEHMRVANLSDEVIGGFCFTGEEEFQKIHRPAEGLSAAEQAESMIRFSNQYPGKFKLRVLLVKGYNDSPEKVAELKALVDQIKYDILWVGTWPKFTVEDERVAEIEKILRG